MHTPTIQAEIGAMLRRQIGTLGITHQRASVFGGVHWLTWLPNSLSIVVGQRILNWQTSGMRANYLQALLVQKGLLAQVRDYASPYKWSTDGIVDAMIATLQDSEVTMLSVRRKLLAMRQSVNAAPSHPVFIEMQENLGSLITINAELFETTQALRWELMESQADADIEAGRITHFTDVGAAIAHLKSITSA